MVKKFQLVSNYKPQGDQPEAIDRISNGFQNKKEIQTLLGVTGSGKTFTMANIIQNLQLPTLVISHNKTLAAQLCNEFKQYFPHNAVGYFVSYYDYYQPEAYIPRTDTYIEKDSSINEEIDRLRLAATANLLERKDVIIVSSVSCIYGLGSPGDFSNLVLIIRENQQYPRSDIINRLIDIQYERNDIEFQRSSFRVRGDIVEVFPAYSESAFRIELFGDVVEAIHEINPLTGHKIQKKETVAIYPAKHFVTTHGRVKEAIKTINNELEERLTYFKKHNKVLEAERLKQRTKYDLEMLVQFGYCTGIENYSRHLSGRNPGEPPATLLDYFPRSFLMIIDESHVTLPQIRGMYAGDKSRKDSLVKYGFRLPSAYDNRPLVFHEFEKYIKKAIFVSATPARYELEKSQQIVEQIIRPTGLADPEVIIKPAEFQIDDLIAEIKKRVVKKERILVTTLTKRMAEDTANYLQNININVRYLHSEIGTIERIKILKNLREGKFDVLVGVNLLREGLDLPEVSLVAILDADKEGFLRSETSLIQTMGRAARNVNGTVILYCNEITGSMQRAINETNRRRKIQLEYNKKYNITPQTIKKPIYEMLYNEKVDLEEEEYSVGEGKAKYLPKSSLSSLLKSLKNEMNQAAKQLDFEKAALLRDEIRRLKKERTMFK
ncbi:MAG: excinuclease ABC subunit UvrB [Atribacterota bacterium]|nr:excinuclease ABC subunit UvrB [Atribacterota bacterium]MDD4287996.1 excinuclease ABC subunit UvrB [Atribacterota bacterium]MDD4764726.1 excinuclease ABC subunit UvrB [Atribacterota bacterium]MDI9597273.1 excinuclease ABC subunit UvrB [Atribacterota bacterium]